MACLVCASVFQIVKPARRSVRLVDLPAFAGGVGKEREKSVPTFFCLCRSGHLKPFRKNPFAFSFMVFFFLCLPSFLSFFLSFYLSFFLFFRFFGSLIVSLPFGDRIILRDYFPEYVSSILSSGGRLLCEQFVGWGGRWGGRVGREAGAVIPKCYVSSADTPSTST